MGIGGLFKDFSGWTSSHGIPQIGGASNLCIRLTWVVIFLGSLAMFGYQLYLIVTKYLAYGVTVSTVLNFEERDFPAVTVCSLNSFKNSRLELSTELTQMMENYSLAVIDPTGAATASVWGFTGLTSEIEVNTRARQNLAFIINGLSDDVKSNLSYAQDEFILQCAYAETACLPSDIKEVWDPIYGRCYQFNNIVPAKYTSTRSGVEHGLRLILKNDQDDFLKLTQLGGARISIHNQNQDPFPDAFGYFAGIGFANQYAVKYSKIVRLAKPYGDCTHEKAGYTFHYESDYSMEGCFRSCFQDQIIADCGCADPRFNAPDGNTLCDVSQIDCANKIFVSQTDSSNAGSSTLDSCKCPQACTQKSFGVITSYSKWPSQEFMPEECAKWDGSSRFASKEACNTWYRGNAMLVEVYFERMTYKLLEENPAYTLYDVVLNFGGQLGLWQGASVITMIEFLAMGLIIALFCFTSKKAPKDKDINYDEDDDDDDMDEIYEAMAEADNSDGEDNNAGTSGEPSAPPPDLSALDPALLYAAARSQQSFALPPQPIDPELSELELPGDPAPDLTPAVAADPELDELFG